MTQILNCQSLAKKKFSSLSKNSLSSQSSSDSQNHQNLEERIGSVLKLKKVGSLAMRESTRSLYFRDTGGQIEFQEILTILINGPSIFFFVMKAHLSLDQSLTLEYRDVDRVINSYESTTTTREALIQT